MQGGQGAFLDISVQKCPEEAVQLQQHISLLPLSFNEIGNEKLILPGVTASVSQLRSHFTLKSFQKRKKNIFCIGRERRLGSVLQFLDHARTSDFGGQ